MVLKGQFLERPTLIQQGDLVLEALSHRGEKRPALLALPPPPAEGSMDHVVWAEVGWASAMAGFPTLRFNGRGVGASQGAPGEHAEQLLDAQAALQLLVENTGAQEVVVASLGGSAPVALRLAAGGGAIRGVVLISPWDLRPQDVAAVRAPLVVVVGEEDRRLDRTELAAAVSKASGHLAVIEKADMSFTRNLPQVGKAVVHLLQRLSGP